MYIVEKPDVAKALLEAMGGRSTSGGNTTGYFVTRNGDEIVPLRGHVLELAPPSEYLNGENRFFDKSVLPIWPTRFIKHPVPERDPKTRQVVVRAGKPVSNRIIKIAVERLKKADVIVHACDIDREGQLIGNEVIEYAGFNPLGGSKSVERLRIAALDKVSLAKLLEKPKEKNSDPLFANLGKAGEVRSRADWLFGMNGSRAYSIGSSAIIHIGRVRVPVAFLVYKRDLEIENFKPHDFFTPIVKLSTGHVLRWKQRLEGGNTLDLDSAGKIIDPVSANLIVKMAQEKGLSLTRFEVKASKKSAPLPFDMPTLRSEMARKMKMTAKQVDNLADALYVKHKLITYIGTDCRYLPGEQFNEAPALLKLIQILGLPGSELADPTRRSPAWNDKETKDSAHHAIIPTGRNPTEISDLTNEERFLFEHIARRYLSQFMPEYEYKTQFIEAKCGYDLFGAQASVVTAPGWHISEGTQPNDSGNSEGEDESE